MSESSEIEEIKRGLEPLIREARQRGLWLFCQYQQLWFSPDELEAKHAEGKFLWGAVNWRLRDPRERLAELWAEYHAKLQEIEAFKKRAGL